MKKHYFLFIVALSFFSCQSVMKTMYGIKNPDVENKKSIQKKANKYGMDDTNIVTVNGKDFLYTMRGKSIPDGAIYDHNGKYIEYRQSDTSCNAGLFGFIPALRLNEVYNQPDTTSLGMEFSKFRDLDGNTLQPLEQADFYLLLYWTVWTGKLNKDHVKVWEDLAKQNTNCKIKVLKVNMDFQEYWDEKDREKIISAMSKKK